MQNGPLTFNKDYVRRCLGGKHELLGSSGYKVRDDPVDGDPGSAYHDTRLTGGSESRFQVSAHRGFLNLEHHAHFPDGAVTPDGKHNHLWHVSCGPGRQR